MADIPQEVREDAYQVVAEMLEYFDGHNLATWAPLASIIERERKAMFLAGKRAGMERAAEIAEADNELCDCHARSESECGCGAWWSSKQTSPLAIAQAIRRCKNDG